MENREFGFKPIGDKDCKILILGTFPGTQSLNEDSYYFFKTNHFWDFIYRILCPEWGKYDIHDSQPEIRVIKSLFSNAQFALWDVIESCERKGSADKDIKNERLNDFDTFFRLHKSVRTIIFNGKSTKANSAYWYFKKQYSHHLEGKNVFTLHSTSPRNPTNTFHVLAEWENILKIKFK